MKLVLVFVFFIAIACGEDIGLITRNLMERNKFEKTNDKINETVTKSRELKPPAIIAGIRIIDLNGTESIHSEVSEGINQTELKIEFTSQIGANINSIVELYGYEENGALAISMSLLMSVVPLIGFLF